MTREDPAAFAPPPAFGPFRVLHQIGVGALGPVFRTYEPTRDRLIAVKVFRLDITPEQAQALADELSRAAEAGLFHPSIVEPVAAGVEGTVAYRAEEYVAAETLDVAIRHYAPAALDTVLPFITQLAGAIDFARAAGVGHGALHLRDIYVTPEEARASGFGVVEALERVGLRAPVRRPYSAPERVAGEAWSTPADVFSLAAICYELLTARRPAGSGAQMGPLGAADAGVHAPDVSLVLSRAMAEDPAARFPTALAFASALEAAARGEPAIGAARLAGPMAAAPAVLAAGAAPDDSLEAAPGEPIDDIAVERSEDELYYDLAEEERLVREAQEDERASPGSSFEGEAESAEDLALEPPPERFTDFTDVGEDGPGGREAGDDRLAAAAAASLLDRDLEEGIRRRQEYFEGVQPSMPYGEPGDVEDARGAYGPGRATPSYGAAGADRDYGGVAVVGPPRGPMLPGAIGLLIGLLMGFAAGYAVAGRSPAAPPDVATDAGMAEPSSPGAQVVPSDTEQRLTPTGAPDVADEVPPPDRAAAAATTGSLAISSTPAKAGVSINGQWRGRTPLTLENQPFGVYDIRVVQDEYAVATEQVALSASAPSRALSFRLERLKPPAAPARPAAAAPRTAPTPPRTPPASQQPTAFVGSIYLDSRPRGARVVLNGKPVGTTPMRIADIPIGSHVVRLELEGHLVWSTSATVQAGEEARVTGSLDPIR